MEELLIGCRQAPVSMRISARKPGAKLTLFPGLGPTSREANGQDAFLGDFHKRIFARDARTKLVNSDHLRSRRVLFAGRCSRGCAKQVDQRRSKGRATRFTGPSSVRTWECPACVRGAGFSCSFACSRPRIAFSEYPAGSAECVRSSSPNMMCSLKHLKCGSVLARRNANCRPTHSPIRYWRETLITPHFSSSPQQVAEGSGEHRS